MDGVQAQARYGEGCGLQQLAAPEWVFEAVPEAGFDQTASLVAEVSRDLWTHPGGAYAEPIPEVVFHQTFGL